MKIYRKKNIYIKNIFKKGNNNKKGHTPCIGQTPFISQVSAVRGVMYTVTSVLTQLIYKHCLFITLPNALTLRSCCAISGAGYQWGGSEALWGEHQGVRSTYQVRMNDLLRNRKNVRGSERERDERSWLGWELFSKRRLHHKLHLGVTGA